MSAGRAEPFGSLRAGDAVRRVRLEGGGLSAGILTLGAILQDLRRAGGGPPLTLGSPDLAAYDAGPMRYFGAVVGPVANRIGGAAAPLDGRVLRFPAEPGPHLLHSGAAGLHARLWEIATLSPAEVLLECRAAPGEGGFPGDRRFRARYALGPEPGALTLSLEAESDRPTLVACTHHGFWDLGQGGVDGHLLTVAADSVLPTDATGLPTGRVAPVSGTRFDFRTPRRLGPGDRLDHNFCLATARGGLRRAAALEGPAGRLTLSTTEPGLQVYTADGFRSDVAGHGGRIYGGRAGLALEPQGWPDAANRPAFPPVRLDAGEVWRMTARFVLG